MLLGTTFLSLWVRLHFMCVWFLSVSLFVCFVGVQLLYHSVGKYCSFVFLLWTVCPDLGEMAHRRTHLYYRYHCFFHSSANSDQSLWNEGSLGSKHPGFSLRTSSVLQRLTRRVESDQVYYYYYYEKLQQARFLWSPWLRAPRTGATRTHMERTWMGYAIRVKNSDFLLCL